MSSIMLIPGLLSDHFVWEGLIDRGLKYAIIPKLTTFSHITEMALYCLSQKEGKLRVAGHSMGARVAMEMARIAPQRLERLALLDTGIHALKEDELEKRQHIIDFAYQHGMEALADRWLGPMVHSGNNNNKSLMNGLKSMVMRMTPEIHERQLTALINRPDAGTYLDAISCPVLLMVGRQDQWSPPSQHQLMKQRIRQSELVIIDNAGHFSLCEQPYHAGLSLIPFFT